MSRRCCPRSTLILKVIFTGVPRAATGPLEPAAIYWPRRSFHVIQPRRRRRRLYYMTVLVGLALITALCTGYHLGRRSGCRPPTWKKRTSRLALGRLTASLVVLVIARRMQRILAAPRGIPAVAGLWGRPAWRFSRMQVALLATACPRRSLRPGLPCRPGRKHWPSAVASSLSTCWDRPGCRWGRRRDRARWSGRCRSG